MADSRLVSIIIPIYNAERYLSECIESAVQQTYHNLEIILVNDGSTDNSLCICKKKASSDQRIIVIDKQNGGVSSARNAALKIAKGDFFLFLDSDDYLEKDAVEKLVSRALRSKSNVVFSAIRIFDAEHSVISSAYTEDEITNLLAIEQCYRKRSWVLAIWAKLFSREAVYKDCKPIYFDDSLKIGEDYLWLIQVLLNVSGYVSCLNSPLYNYRRFSDSFSLSNYKAARYIERKEALLKADKIVINLSERYSKHISNFAKRRFISDCINGEVIIYCNDGAKSRRLFFYQYKSFFTKLLYSKGIGMKLRCKALFIHYGLLLLPPKWLIERCVAMAEKKRQENLYL